jgi:uncharacterized protein (DUF427 family)
MSWRGHPTPDPVSPGQESVWDYPRPPRLERSDREVVVALGDSTIARSRRSLRILETSHPPTYYVPPADVDFSFLTPAPGTSFCEWKGAATYWTVTASGIVVEAGAWSYPDPTPDYAELADHLAFYPARFTCTIDGEPVRPQAGGFYGGWVTDDVVGPFKGEPGTLGW